MRDKTTAGKAVIRRSEMADYDALIRPTQQQKSARRGIFMPEYRCSAPAFVLRIQDALDIDGSIAMRLAAVFIILLLISVPAIPAEEPGAGDAERSGASGTIYAIVKVKDDSETEFISGPDSNLPGKIIAKVVPALMAKAREAHTRARSDDGIYSVAIDWKITTVDGQDQMRFEYRNSYPYVIQQLAPEFPRMNSPMPVKIVFNLSVEPDGTVSSVHRGEAFPGNPGFYHAGKLAMRRWKFSPRYKDGVAVASDVQIPFTFKIPTHRENEWPSGKVKVSFGVSDNGEVDWLDIDGELPECVDEAELRLELVTQVNASNVVRQIRAGKSTLRRGAFLHELEPCEGTQADQ